MKGHPGCIELAVGFSTTGFHKDISSDKRMAWLSTVKCSEILTPFDRTCNYTIDWIPPYSVLGHVTYNHLHDW